VVLVEVELVVLVVTEQTSQLSLLAQLITQAQAVAVVVHQLVVQQVMAVLQEKLQA
jgi:hypothetical protein